MTGHQKERAYENFNLLIFDYVRAMVLMLYLYIIFVYSIDYFEMEEKKAYTGHMVIRTMIR